MLNIVFFCIFFILIGTIFSKIKICIEKIEVNINNIDFKIKIGIFLFGFLKIFSIKCNKKGIKILGKFYSYKKLFKHDLNEIIRKLLKNIKIKKTKKISFKIDFSKFTLRVGTEDMFITVFIVTVLSSIISEFLKRKIQKINKNNINYKVIPEFNKLMFFYEGKTDISIKTLNLFNFKN